MLHGPMGSYPGNSFKLYAPIHEPDMFGCSLCLLLLAGSIQYLEQLILSFDKACTPASSSLTVSLSEMTGKCSLIFALMMYIVFMIEMRLKTTDLFSSTIGSVRQLRVDRHSEKRRFQYLEQISACRTVVLPTASTS